MTVRVFRSTDTGAPINWSPNGSLVGILDGCLVRGYGHQEVSIARVNEVATVTTAVAHGLKDGTFITISGAADAAYNGDFAITVTSNTAFTYTVTGTPATPAVSTTAATSNRTILLIHADTTVEGDTTIIDEVGHQVVAYGAARLTKTAYKFGTSSIYTDATGYHVKSSSPDYALGSSSFTMECWVNPIKCNGAAGGVFSRIVQIGNNTTAGTFVVCTVGTDNPTSGTNVASRIQVAGYTTGYVYPMPTPGTATSANTLAVGSWTHIAVVRVGDVWTVYINGVLISTVTLAHTISGTDLYIGGNSVGAENFYGYIDEVRISKGAVYTANFTPPTAPFTADSAGAIRMNITPVGWGRPFSGTNKAVYKQGVGSNGFYMRIEDNQATSSYPIMAGYETMSDVDSGTGLFINVRTSSNRNNGTNVNMWVVVATEKIIYAYMLISNAYFSLSVFGDFTSHKQGDIYNTIGIGMEGDAVINTYYGWVLSTGLANITTANCHMVARACTQIGGAIQCGKESGHGATIMGGSTGAIVYPSPMDGGLHLDTVRVTEGSNGVRGVLPGLWNPLHLCPLNGLDVVHGTGPYLGKTFLAIRAYGSPVNAMAFLEISNTW